MPHAVQAATTNEPIPPSPITATLVPGSASVPRTACRATASGWAMIATSAGQLPTDRLMRAGTFTRSARPPSTCSSTM